MRKYLIAALIVTVASALAVSLAANVQWAGAQSTTGTTGGTAPEPTLEPPTPTPIPPTPTPTPDVLATAIADLALKVDAVTARVNVTNSKLVEIRDQLSALDLTVDQQVARLLAEIDENELQAQNLQTLISDLNSMTQAEFVQAEINLALLREYVEQRDAVWFQFFEDWRAVPAPTPGGTTVEICNQCPIQ